jgi:hypothetical protein
MYPSASPKHMEASTSGDGEYHLAFSFTTADDPNKVYSWYEKRLKKLEFRVNFDVTPHSVGHLLSNTFDNHRSFNMRNYPTTPQNTFTVELMER